MRLKLCISSSLAVLLFKPESKGVKGFCNAQAVVPARVRIVKGVPLQEDWFKCSLLDGRVRLSLCASRLASVDPAVR